jgi:hypothetical protein
MLSPESALIVSSRRLSANATLETLRQYAEFGAGDLLRVSTVPGPEPEPVVPPSDRAASRRPRRTDPRPACEPSRA